jgi:hypothetical protein
VPSSINIRELLGWRFWEKLCLLCGSLKYHNRLMNAYAYLKHLVEPMNTSPFLAGISMLMLNIGSKYIELGLSSNQENALRAGIAREFLIFAMVFIATKNILLSILMTAAFVLLTDHIFNDKSKLCVCPTYFHKIASVLDTNGDNIISDKEVEHAITILRQSNKKNK